MNDPETQIADEAGEKGAKSEDKGLLIRAGEGAIKRVSSEIERSERAKRVGEWLLDTRRTVLHGLNLAPRDEIEELREEVESLRERLASVEAAEVPRSRTQPESKGKTT